MVANHTKDEKIFFEAQLKAIKARLAATEENNACMKAELAATKESVEARVTSTEAQLAELQKEVRTI